MGKKTIIIGGGVGPEAGRLLHGHINSQVTAETDQGNPRILHASCPDLVTDRTKFLQEGGENPAEGMYQIVKVMVEAAKALGQASIIGVPCNTFHAPKIFTRFEQLVKENLNGVELLNMIDETGRFIRENFEGVSKIGLLSTTGTRSAGMYPAVLDNQFELLQVPESMQDRVHEAIYNQEWGIKANKSLDNARQEFLEFVENLKGQGAEAIILGCTEIPIVLTESSIDNIHLVDPMFALATAMVKKAVTETI